MTGWGRDKTTNKTRGGRGGDDRGDEDKRPARLIYTNFACEEWSRDVGANGVCGWNKRRRRERQGENERENAKKTL